MFRSAVVKLTAWYVGALLIVCLLFSFPAYNIASQRLRNGAERQTEVLQRLSISWSRPSLVPRLEEAREKQLQQDRNELLKDLILYNALILIVGAGASYWFARHTLRPIEETHKAQTRFTADASHELRTPLATMQAEIDVALRDKKLTLPEARNILKSNLEEIGRLQQLSEQLLNLTRLQANRSDFRNVNLSRLIYDKIEQLQKTFKHTIALSAPKRLVVHGDAALLKQVIDIIVTNAINYADQADPQVSVKLEQAKGDARIVVSNTGPGIEEQDLARIFERFYRGKNATKQGVPGHGIGLSLAKQIIDLHGGSIAAQSQKNKETTFIILLPATTTT